MNPLNLAAWCAALFLAANLFPHTVALRLVMLALGLALVAFELARAKMKGQPAGVQALPPLLVPILLWAAWAALSVLWSAEPDRSIKEFKNEVVYVFLGYWLCYVAAQSRIALRLFSAALATGATVASAAVIYDFWFPSSWLPEVGLYNGPGDQTSALLTLMPCALIGAWLAAKLGMSRSVRAASIALPIIFALSAYATLNRTVWLGFAAQIIILGVLLTRHSRFSVRRVDARWHWRAGLIAACILIAGAGMTWYIQKYRAEHGWDRPVASDLRLELWPDVIHSIEERPMTGYGFGRGIIRHELREEFQNPHLWHPHNLFLSIGVELGLPGVALLLILLGATVREGWRIAADQDTGSSALGAAVIAVVAGMVIRNMTDMLWARQNSLLYWGVVGALLAFAGVRDWGSRRPGRHVGAAH